MPDRLTRWFAGDEVEMSLTDWCGNLMFTTARFRRTRSYGMIATEPLANGSVRVRVIVFVPRSRGPLRRMFVDPLHGWIRRLFIMKFLSSDAPRLNGAGITRMDCSKRTGLWRSICTGSRLWRTALPIGRNLVRQSLRRMNLSSRVRGKDG